MPRPFSQSAGRGPGARKSRTPRGIRIFIDFDNTISEGDVLDGIIERFSSNDHWRTLEAEWEAGRIGARVCLDGQIRGLRASWARVAKHLDSVSLDPGFFALRDLLRSHGIDLTIVSDNFDLFVGHILSKVGADGVALRANHLEFSGEHPVPSFPFFNPKCPDCAHCKKTHFVPPNADSRTVVYIGDGRSDLCPAREADIVFAKSGLRSLLQEARIDCIAFDGLSDVVAKLPKIIHEYTT